jgi:CHAT domain-containing protein
MIGRKPAPKAVAVLADPVFAADDSRVGHGGGHRKRNGDADHAPAWEEKLAASPSLNDPASSDRLTRSVTDIGLDEQRGGSLRRLPFSRREAKAILSVTPAGQGMEALDFDASRTTATDPKLSQYRIVHFATHGLLDNEHPELSGLVLSLVNENGKPQNGFLQLEDVYNLNLSADLVVLSACQTGLGKEVRGEGLVGLTRGFMYAGAPRVVASLWSVDDAATEELMVRFYRAMEQQGMRPAAALRQAQVAMSKEGLWRDPYYWAGFVLEGEWK